MIKTEKAAIHLMAVIVCLFFFACATNNAVIENQQLAVKSFDGGPIAYGVKGQNAPTLLFIHGWLGDHTIWRSQVDYFSKNYKVAWLDLAGHGKSKTNRKIFTMSAFAQDVMSIANVDEVGGEKIILVGHSMGGPVAIEAANLLGEKVVGIVGVDSFYTPLAAVPEEKKLDFLEKLKMDYPNALAETVSSMFTQDADPELKASTFQNMLAADHKMGISALHECIKWNSRKEPLALKKFSDKLYNINAAPTGNEKSIHESVVLIPGVGHFIPRVKPDEFNTALQMIIDQIL